MRLTSRSYPHPVVGNRDDVPGAAFQAAIDMTTDKEAVYIDTEVKCSSRTVNELISRKDASFVIHIECSNTLFRKAFEFFSEKYRIEIPVDYLNDAVEVNVFARAVRPLSGYKVESAHPEYGDASFNLERGDVLAVGDGHVFYIEPKFDALSPIGSIMEIHRSFQEGDIPMRVQYNSQKIQILLSQRDFADYKWLKNTEGLSVALSTTIVLPVLVEAIRIARDEGHDDLRWVRALRSRMESLGLKPDEESLELAQQILELPVKRMLASGRMFAEGAA